MNDPWWFGLSPVEAHVSCSDVQHRLEWCDGVIATLDHDDLDGERMLVALGGQRTPCVDVVTAWRRHASDLRVLTLASRGSSDAIVRPGGVFPTSHRSPMKPSVPMNARMLLQQSVSVSTTMTPHAAGWTGYTPLPRNATVTRHRTPGQPALVHQLTEPDELQGLLTLEARLIDRLSATVAADWCRRIHDKDELVVSARPALEAALFGRVTAAVREWLDSPSADVDVEMIGVHEPPAVSAGKDGTRVSLPFDWIVDVWAKGLTVVMGHFCLAATLKGPHTLLLETVPVPSGAHATLRLEIPDRRRPGRRGRR